MKNPLFKMNLLMSLTMSLVMSLTGNLSSGSFTLPAFLKSFLISFPLSLLIGFLVPMKKISDSLMEKRAFKEDSIQGRCLSSLVSSLGYTPVVCFVMVYLAYRSALAHGAKLNFLSMLARSMAISLAVSFVLSFLIAPVYAKRLFKTGNRKDKQQAIKSGQNVLK